MENDPKQTQRPGETGPESDEDAIVEWSGKIVRFLKGFGVRVFVHIAALVCGGAVAATSASVMAGVCVYTGVICLVARGISPTPDWLLPAGLGAVQTAVLAVFGLPLPQAIFWGGAQAWLQRRLQKHLAIDSEWLALLLLLPVGIYLVAGMASLKILPLSFFALFIAGRGLARIIHRLQNPVSEEEKRRRSLPEPEKVTVYRASLTTLDAKIPQLPRSLQPVAASIATSTGNILECMVQDPRDLEPGHRFLNRYLVAVHTVVDKHIRLARENTITPEIIEALTASEDMLTRLNTAFAQEHARLLQNDVSDFSADLSVLDTLLKMDGR
ncbi:5-bromo-4-chloroindolyl phosphate hydrolysis family protein [Desulfovibrio sp. OttesenSCG-928-O18]|nr:5-bromo-4-chloroindolyl phosphate hydrolysis family protein [Desulfovibrio sp. OttesenSCG-928-O18]